MTDPLSVLFLRNFSVKPVQQLVVGDHSNDFGLCIDELKAPDFDSFLFVEIEFLDECDFILFLNYLGPRKIVLREITITFGFVLLNAGAQHENLLNIVLFDHPPKVVHCELCNRSLAGDRLLAFYVDHIGIYIVLDILLVLLLPD